MHQVLSHLKNALDDIGELGVRDKTIAIQIKNPESKSKLKND